MTPTRGSRRFRSLGRTTAPGRVEAGGAFDEAGDDRQHESDVR